MNNRRHTAKFGIVIAAVCAVVFAGFGALEGLLRSRGEPGRAQYIASFACFGFLLGAILAFDPSPDMKSPDRPILRTLLGALAGLCLGLVWNWSAEALALSTLVSAGLGYTGMAWAKHF
jgi:drug/metabolite transporter (DMT)-like permease